MPSLGSQKTTTENKWGCSKAPLRLRCTEGLVCAAIINKASKAPEGEEFETSSKNTCILITHQLFMRKPSPLGSNFQGLCLLGCCLGAAQKPFPETQSCPAEPLPPALCQDRCRHRDSPTSSYPGTGSPGTRLSALAGSSPTYLLPVFAAKSLPWSQGAEERRAAQQLQPRDMHPWL